MSAAAIPDVLRRCMHAARIEADGTTLRGNVLTAPDGQRYYARVVRGTAAVAQARGEAEGLRHMALTGDINPRLVRWSEKVDGREAAVISEYFELGRGLGEEEQRELARGLARMHRARHEVERDGEGPRDGKGKGKGKEQEGGVEAQVRTPWGPHASTGLGRETLNTPSPPAYGFPVPTHCGVTQLDNTWEQDWATFFRKRRLGDMVRRLQDKEVDAAWEAMQGK